ncbi:MAG: aminotransferase class I/II-fold pyridoxal phosphate-dependent enzyme, partial [Pyrinomonadaceae bacterium]
LPRRLQSVQTTLIRQIFEKAQPGSINFGLGEPDLPTPQFIRDEAARVSLAEQNGYTSHAGLLSLREKIAADYPNLNLTPNEVVVTCGSQEAMTGAMLSIVDDGDEVLIPDPVFAAYPNVIRLAGGIPVTFKLPQENDFGFELDEFKSKITARTKAVVIVSPSNPTGKIFTENDLRAIADCLKDTGAFVISDEIYRDLYFGETRPASISDFYERTVIVSGLSKSMSMTGWRLGWVCSGVKELMRAENIIHGYLTVCASTISQKAALKAWSGEAQLAVETARQIYKARRDFFLPLIEKELNLRAISPDGAFYTMVDVRQYGDDLKIAEKLLEHKVITVPGVAFGEESRGFLRISFCSNEETLAEGVQRIKSGLKSL